MLKRLPTTRAKELIAAAATASRSDPLVSYPRWYLHRWHFLPEGYLSRRSAAGYEHVIRRLYYQCRERHLNAAVVAELRKLRPASVLEVGCGPGRLLESVSEAEVTQDLVGVDLSPYLLERAEERAPAARLAHANGLSLPADEGAFDAVVASHYLGHLPARVRPAALREMARVLRPGGHLLLVDHRWHPTPRAATLEVVRRIRHNLGLIDVILYRRTSLEGAPA
jgi:ubiquinone/menaquinone biosynthesis C-methylase UbiE